MTDKELRRLSRRDLLELMVLQEQENETLKARIISLEERLNSRTIEIENAGSIAEAALILNGVLESTEKAAEQYLDNIKRCSEKQETAYLEIVRAAEQKAAEIIHAAEEERDKEIEARNPSIENNSTAQED